MPAPARRARFMWRLPLLAIGMLSMALATWLGLVRLGWNLPLPQSDLLVAHGPLMIGGFLGTLISLERAVALGAVWGYAGPVFTAAGAIAVVLTPGAAPGPLFITLGSAVVIAIFIVVCRRQPTMFTFTMGAGAIAWLAGNVQWLQGAPVVRVVAWWIAFPVLTIAGERLELHRVLRPTRGVRIAFAAATLVLAAGVATTAVWRAEGVRILGAGLLALTLWLTRYDVARRTIRQRGLTRFMAVCLLAGYAWLGIGGAIAIVTGVAATGVVYDAMLHAIFLGFVMSMVFAHAPVIFPAVLGRPMEYRPAFYVHASVLHASVALRIAGDLVESLARLRAWGGLLNAVALLLFVANTVRAIVVRRGES